MSEPAGTDTPIVDTAAPADWASAIPEAYRAEKVWEPYQGKPLGEVLKGYAEASKLIGRKTEGMVRVPTEKSTPEEVAAYRQALGVPETPEQYALTFAEGIPRSEALETKFRALAHKRHLPPAVVNELVALDAERFLAGADAMKAAEAAEKKAAEGTLRQEWGGAYEHNVEKAKRAIRMVLADESDEVRDAVAAMGNDPRVVKAWWRVFDTLQEAGADFGDVGGTMMTPQAAREKAMELMADPVYRNVRDPKYPALKREIDRLWEIASPRNAGVVR